MKIKSLLGYFVPLFILFSLFLLVLTVQFSPPPETASVKACKRYASCVAMSARVPDFLNFR